MVWLDVQGLDRNVIGNLVTMNFGKRYMDTPLSLGKKKDIFISCECLPKHDLSRDGFQ